MSRSSLAAPLAATVVCLAAAPAVAGASVPVGPGLNAGGATVDVLVDPSGTAADVAWRAPDTTGAADRYAFNACRVTLTRTPLRCDRTPQRLGSILDANGAAKSLGPVRLLRQADGRTYVVTDQAGKWLWERPTGATSFGPVRQLSAQGGTTERTTPVLTRDGASILFPAWGSFGASVSSAPIAGDAALTSNTILDRTAANGAANPASNDVAPLADGSTIAVVSGAGGNPHLYRLPAGGDPNLTTAWGTAARVPGVTGRSALGANAGTAFLATRTSGGLEVRKTTGATFGPPVTTATGATPNLQVDVSPGARALVVGTLGSSSLRAVVSRTAGASFSTSQVAADEPIGQPALSVGDDGRGLAVWTGRGGEVRMAPIAPGPQLVRRGGFGLEVPAGCLSGAALTQLRLSTVRRLRSGSRIRSVEFLVDGRRVGTDRRAPYSLSFKLPASAKAKAKAKITARITVVRRDRTTSRTTVLANVAPCGAPSGS
ncbi:hypothetical protein [Patulibacter minatonensis]|uniref:hypothetical protein n=1 Tax=Patulibacter minatonensis TaxID=298163 RepID=UPI00047C66CC|nr:hypothetical protein [Patulibacter minatonensis]